MRDIKFRCWNAFSSCMHDWAEMVDKNKIHLLSNENKAYVCEQYTGLKDMDNQELFDGDIVNIFYVRNGFIHDGNYLISIDVTGIKFTFVGLSWSSYGYNQYPVHSYLIFSDYGMLRSDYRNHEKPNSACIGNHDGAEYSNYIKLIGNKHQNPELVGES